MYLTVLHILLSMPVVIFLVAVILWRSVLYPRQAQIPLADGLIVAAHPDDCVIAAGEYGIECVRGGKQLRIVYMTCGATTADSQHAKLRRTEAALAWSKANLAPACLTFMDAPESSPDEAPRQSAECLDRIASKLREAVARLSPGSVVVVPAAAERHVDHRTLRRIAIAAIAACGREDLLVYEAPEYSNYISLVCNPFRALRVLLGLLPVVWRIAGRVTLDAPYAYCPTFGLGAVRFPADESRLRLKGEMLSTFVSQGTLQAAFGRPDVFRRVRVDKAARQKEVPFGMRVGNFVYTSTTLLFVCSVILSIAALVATVTVAFAH